MQSQRREEKNISKSKCTKHTSSRPLLEVEMSKKCTPLWREEHFEVKMHKTHTQCSDHFWKLRCLKSARRCGAKHISNSKCTEHTSSGPLLEVEMTKKCTSLRREAHFEVKHVQNTPAPDHFWTFRCRFAWQAQGIVDLAKSLQKVRVLYSMSKNDGRRGAFEQDLQRCIFRGRRSTRDMSIRDIRRFGR